jgi:PH (Pleckstrin Homology) domain-containing protein
MRRRPSRSKRVVTREGAQRQGFQSGPRTPEMISPVSGELRGGMVTPWGKLMRKMGYKTTEEMRQFLEGETLLASARYGSEGEGERQRPLLVATDRRLLTMAYGRRYHRVYREIPYEHIAAVTSRRNIFSYRITVTLNSPVGRKGRRTFDRLSRSDAEEMVAVIRERVDAAKRKGKHPKHR